MDYRYEQQDTNNARQNTVGTIFRQSLRFPDITFQPEGSRIFRTEYNEDGPPAPFNTSTAWVTVLEYVVPLEHRLIVRDIRLRWANFLMVGNSEAIVLINGASLGLDTPIMAPQNSHENSDWGTTLVVDESETFNVSIRRLNNGWNPGPLYARAFGWLVTKNFFTLT